MFIEGGKLQPLFQEALSYPPIDLGRQEMMWLYRVRENQQTIDRGLIKGLNPYIVFTNGHIAFQGDAQFDLNYWDYANFD